MPFDMEDHHGGGGGRGHRQATPEQCSAMHDLLDAYMEVHDICPDCTTVRMGVGLLTYVAMDIATNDNTTGVDRQKLDAVRADLHRELDQWLDFVSSQHRVS